MVELVTGHANKAHATAEQAAGLNAGILGLDDYVFDVHDKFELTVVSANKVTIGTGELVMQGRHVSQGTPEDLIVTNGSQGQKRNDLIVCRYTKGSQSVESAELVVVRGTPTTGTPTDPALNTTSPLDGGTTYDMPLYRIPLDGITIGTPVPLFNVLRPMSDVWDSLTPLHLYTGSSVLYDAGSGGYATLWTFSQFRQQFGRDWGDDVCISAMNGDWDANGRQVTSVRVTRSGNRIDVMFDGKNTAHIRVNWAVMWRG
ncbi:hypothetical protein [Bifidobacterium longum]|uniref:hypothetical protein n=1 Tax=Bifidobacterium longum TaxID=216816 RepID=UPI0023EE23B1|nr:hypothetical protein [Bifidobacterium longum]MDF4083472.1 hypothetical protein [Bifidobacterium longum]